FDCVTETAQKVHAHEIFICVRNGGADLVIGGGVVGRFGGLYCVFVVYRDAQMHMVHRRARFMDGPAIASKVVPLDIHKLGLKIHEPVFSVKSIHTQGACVHMLTRNVGGGQRHVERLGKERIDKPNKYNAALAQHTARSPGKGDGATAMTTMPPPLLARLGLAVGGRLPPWRTAPALFRARSVSSTRCRGCPIASLGSLASRPFHLDAPSIRLSGR